MTMCNSEVMVLGLGNRVMLCKKILAAGNNVLLAFTLNQIK